MSNWILGAVDALFKQNKRADMTKYCMGCRQMRDYSKPLDWGVKLNKWGKVSRKICPVCVAGAKKYSVPGKYERA